MGNNTSTLPQKDGPPTVFGIVAVLFIWTILCVNLILMLYYKTMAESSGVEQIACPDSKWCLAPGKPRIAGYTVSANFPSTIAGYSQGEQLTIPYFKSFDDSTQSTFTITIDINTTSVPAGGVKFMNITGAGYYVDTGSTATIYLNGVDSYTTLDTFVPELIRAALESDSSDLRKRAFFRTTTLPKNGIPMLNLHILPKFSSVSASSLSFASSVSDSNLLSGTNSLDFVWDEPVSNGKSINLYDNYNYISKLNIAPAFSTDLDEPKNNYTSCVDPGYVPTTCTGKMYNSNGQWVPEEGDPNGTYLSLDAAWAEYDRDTASQVKMCTFNKVEDPNYYEEGNIGGFYQTNAVAQKVLNNIWSGNQPTLEWKYDAGAIEANGSNGYVQDIIFCGGADKVGTTNVNTVEGKVTNPDISVPQKAVWPNNTNAADNYTSFGFN